MLYFSVAGFCQLHRFLRIDLEYSILDGILDLGQHIVAVAVNHLYELADLSPRVRHILFLAPSFAFLLIVNGQSLGKHSDQWPVAGEVDRTLVFDQFITILIRLFDGNVQSDQRLSRSRYTGYKADALLSFLTTCLDHIENIRNGAIGRYLVGFVAGDVLYRVAFIELLGRFNDGWGG